MPAFVRPLKHYALPLKFAVVAAILAILMVRTDWNKLITQLSGLDPLFSLSALILILIQISMLAWRWQVFMNAEKHLVSYFQSLNIVTASQLANSVLITSVGGVIVRIALAQYYGMTLLKSVCAAIADRFMTLLAIIFFAVLFIPALLPVLPTRLAESVIVIAIIVLGGVVFFPAFAMDYLKPFILRHRQLASTAIYLRHLMMDRKLWVPVAASSLLAQLFFFLSVCFAAAAIDVQFSIPQMIAVLPLITVIASLPLGLGGWGVREGAFAFGLGLIGINIESALLISIQIGLLGILSSVLAAIPAFFTGSLQSAFSKAIAYSKTRKV